MSYETICKQNRYYYYLLESLTSEISVLEQENSNADTSIHQAKKDELKVLINVNLNKMEQLWNKPSELYRKAKRLNRQYQPSELEERIILSYQHNPDKRQEDIAAQHHTSLNRVSYITTKLLNKQFIGY